MRMVRDPNSPLPGYVGSEVWQLFDEPSLRDELVQIGATVEDVGPIIDRARANFAAWLESR